MLGFKTLATPSALPEIIPPPRRISVRAAGERDLRAIPAVENGGEHVDPFDAQTISLCLRSPLADACIAKVGLAIVGWGFGTWRRSGHYDIAKVVVLPEFRRRGVGRAILSHLRSSAIGGRPARASAVTIRATTWERNTAALCFLRQCGFGCPVILRDWCDPGEDGVRQFWTAGPRFEGPISGFGTGGMTP